MTNGALARLAVRRGALAATLLACTGFACRTAPAGLDPNADLTVLFIGNSLTASNDLPALTRAVAAAGGRTLSHAVRLAPNFSLEDHWHAGVADLIRSLRADVVVLQQGPSSLPASQEHLRLWTETLAVPIGEAGGRPALFMVWPEAARSFAFDDVAAAYRGAAEAVDGIFIPAGDAWRAVWSRDPGAALYGGDGFHPSHLGSLVAALTMYAVLFDADVRALPHSVASGIPASQFETLLAAVHESVQASGLMRAMADPDIEAARLAVRALDEINPTRAARGR